MLPDEEPMTFFTRFDSALVELTTAREEPIPETRKLNYLLLALPDSYDSFIEAFDFSSAEKRLLDFVKAQFIIKSKRRDNNETKMYTDDGENSNAFKSQLYKRSTTKNDKRYSSDNERFYNNNKYRETVKCFRCGKPGHLKKNCRVSAFRIQGQNKQPEAYNSEIETEHLSFIVRVEDGQIFVAGKKKNTEIEWIVDSEATNYVTTTDQYFKEFVELKNTEVKVGDGNSLNVPKVGSIDIALKTDLSSRTCITRNVFYVPEMKSNLLSISRLTENGIKISIARNTMKLFNRDKLIAEAVKKNKLYCLKSWLLKSNDVLPANSNIFNSLSVIEKWYKTLGHVNF